MMLVWGHEEPTCSCVWEASYLEGEPPAPQASEESGKVRLGHSEFGVCLPEAWFLVGAAGGRAEVPGRRGASPAPSTRGLYRRVFPQAQLPAG